VLLVGACGGSDSDGDATEEPTEEPTAAATTETPSDEELFDGDTAADFYGVNCSACHGPDRGGVVGPGLTPDLLVEDDATYVDAILNGRDGTVMPAWAAQGVSQAEAEALVAFFRTEP